MGIPKIPLISVRISWANQVMISEDSDDAQRKTPNNTVKQANSDSSGSLSKEVYVSFIFLWFVLVVFLLCFIITDRLSRTNPYKRYQSVGSTLEGIRDLKEKRYERFGKNTNYCRAFWINLFKFVG